jgi:phosphomannomutase
MTGMNGMNGVHGVRGVRGVSVPAGVLPGDLVARVEAWMAADPDPTTRAELSALLEKGDEDGLRDRFDHPLSFGTAGLRGALGAGPGRMNRLVVRKASAGLAQFLVQHDGGPVPSVVVGHDARHGSVDFARDAARVAAASGVVARQFETALPTPVTAFAVRHLHASAGIMVTASHNPAPDNGYKVYLGDGAQVIPPYDAEIAGRAAHAAVPDEAALSRPRGDLLQDIDEAALLAAYRRTVLEVVEPGGPRQLRTVYSPLHGVGGAVLPGLLEEAGFDPPVLVAAQATPDPDFPTAPFPNPEEPGVLDLALADAERTRADLVLVNDPDADRLAVALPDPSGPGFRPLSGDELGVLLADHLISTTSGADRLVATTVVSSSMLSDLAHQAGVAYAETLTGFKWIARAASVRPHHRLLFGYEEALGYAVTDAIGDKDGMSAALVVADMAARARQEGRSLFQRLDELAAALGVHATAQWSLRLGGSNAAQEMAALMARWRARPPRRIAGLEVADVRDLARGEDGLPPSDVLVLRLGREGQAGQAGRVVLRPSGTEPKLKVYFEATTGPGPVDELPEARRAARARLGELRDDVTRLLTAAPTPS